MFSVSLFTLLLLLLLLLLWHIFCLVGIQFIWGKFGDFEVGSFWLAPNSNPPPFPFGYTSFRLHFGFNSVPIRFQFSFNSISFRSHQFDFSSVSISYWLVWDRFGIGLGFSLGFSLGSNRWINSRKLTGKLKQLIWIRFQFNPVRSRSIPFDPVRSRSIPLDPVRSCSILFDPMNNDWRFQRLIIVTISVWV